MVFFDQNTLAGDWRAQVRYCRENGIALYRDIAFASAVADLLQLPHDLPLMPAVTAAMSIPIRLGDPASLAHVRAVARAAARNGQRASDRRLRSQAYLGHRSINSTTRYAALASGRFKNIWGRRSCRPCDVGRESRAKQRTTWKASPPSLNGVNRHSAEGEGRERPRQPGIYRVIPLIRRRFRVSCLIQP